MINWGEERFLILRLFGRIDSGRTQVCLLEFLLNLVDQNGKRFPDNAPQHISVDVIIVSVRKSVSDRNRWPKRCKFVIELRVDVSDSDCCDADNHEVALHRILHHLVIQKLLECHVIRVLNDELGAPQNVFERFDHFRMQHR